MTAQPVTPEAAIERMAQKSGKLHDAAKKADLDLVKMAEYIIALPQNKNKKVGRISSQLIQYVKEQFMEHVENVVLLGGTDRLDSAMPGKIHMIAEGTIIETNTWGFSGKIDGIKQHIPIPGKAKKAILKRSQNPKYNNTELVSLEGFSPIEPQRARKILIQNVMNLDQVRKIALNNEGKPTYAPVIMAFRISDIQAVPSEWSDAEGEGRPRPTKYSPLIVGDARSPPEAHPCMTITTIPADGTTASLRLDTPKYARPFISFEEPLIEENNDDGEKYTGILPDCVREARGEGKKETPLALQVAEIVTDELAATPIVVMGTITRWTAGEPERINMAVSALIETQELVTGPNSQTDLGSYEVSKEPSEVSKEPKKATKAKEPKGYDEPVKIPFPKDEDEKSPAPKPTKKTPETTDTEKIANKIAESAPKREKFNQGVKKTAQALRQKQINSAVNAIMIATKTFIDQISDEDLIKAVQKTIPDTTMKEIQVARKHFEK